MTSKDQHDLKGAVNDDCCPTERDCRSARTYRLARNQHREKSRLAAFWRFRDGCCSTGRRPCPRCTSRVCRWWIWHGRWCGRCSFCSWHRGTDEGTDHLVPDATGSVFPGTGAGWSPFRSGHLCRVRQGRRCACQYGGGVILRWPGCRRRRTCPIANGRLAQAAACSGADRDNGVGCAPVEAADRGQ